MNLSKITAKQFTFIGLAMLAASTIILITWFSINPGRQEFLKHEACLEKWADTIWGMDYKKEVMRNESEIIKNATIYNICSREAPDPATIEQLTQISYIVLFTASMLLVFGAIVSLSGVVAMLKVKIKNRMRRRRQNKN
jgi:hypothetical protein